MYRTLRRFPRYVHYTKMEYYNNMFKQNKCETWIALNVEIWCLIDSLSWSTYTTILDAVMLLESLLDELGLLNKVATKGSYL